MYVRGIFVGNDGDSSLSITGGEDVFVTATDSDLSCIGFQPGSSGAVIVDGVGSSWHCGRNLLVGREGNGVLLIGNRGIVSNSDQTSSGHRHEIGNEEGSSGTVIVDGVGSAWRIIKGTIQIEDGHDFLIWQRGLGLTDARRTTAESIPEPATDALAIIILLAQVL
ncbi:MAG: hypothetical protein JW829_13435 [Pirellulales bacterium]|nr:hypothetical protein [Pirellulales bacterium]